MSLNPNQFPDDDFDWGNIDFKAKFHGTSQEIKGKTLKPSAKTGKENYDYEGSFTDTRARQNNVFFTQHDDYLTQYPEKRPEARAWQWATMGTHNNPRFGTGGRPRVYKVQPRGEVQRDDATEGAGMAPSARILDRIDIPPLSAVRQHLGPSENWAAVRGGVQGTLPMANWDTHVDKERRRKNENDEISTRWDQTRAEDIAKTPDPNQLHFFTDRRYKLAENEYGQATMKEVPGSGSTWRGKPW